jgi:hypothetical protein
VSIYFVRTESIAGVGQNGSDPITYEPADIDRSVYVKNLGVFDPANPSSSTGSGIRLGFDQGSGGASDPRLALSAWRTDGGLDFLAFDHSIRFVLPAGYPLVIGRFAEGAANYQIAVTPVT